MWRAMFQGFCLMGKGGKLLIFVLHTRRLTRPQDLNHCLVKRLEHKLWNLMVQVVLTLWLIMWIWAQVLLSYTDSLKKICDMVFLTFFIGGIVPNTQCAVINTGNLVPIPKRLMGEPLCKRILTSGTEWHFRDKDEKNRRFKVFYLTWIFNVSTL